MRRALTAATGTAAGLVALLSFKSGTVPRRSVAVSTPGTTPSTAGNGTVSSATSPTTSPSTTAPARTALGPVEENRYGPVQVKVTVQGSKVLDVQAVQLPSDRPRSADISDQVAPMLRQEALDSQSAQIDLISGATYTSASYAQSLQAALDSARQ